MSCVCSWRLFVLLPSSQRADIQSLGEYSLFIHLPNTYYYLVHTYHHGSVCVSLCVFVGEATAEVFHPSLTRALGLNKNLSIPVTVRTHTDAHGEGIMSTGPDEHSGDVGIEGESGGI